MCEPALKRSAAEPGVLLLVLPWYDFENLRLTTPYDPDVWTDELVTKLHDSTPQTRVGVIPGCNDKVDLADETWARVSDKQASELTNIKRVVFAHADL